MNPLQIKIISVAAATFVFALVIDNIGSSGAASSSSMNAYAADEKPHSKIVYAPKDRNRSCYKNNIALYGKVQFVDSFPDLKIQYVSSFPDIKVEFVSSFPSSCGKWQKVDSFPDFKVQVVSSFADLKVQKVSSFPGMN